MNCSTTYWIGESLAEPDISADTNRRSRWPDSEFWRGLRGIAAQWADGVDWPVLHVFSTTMKPMSEAYAKQLAGVIAGGNGTKQSSRSKYERHASLS